MTTLKTTDDATATATCSYCPWTVQHSGPAGEVAPFIRAKLMEHVEAVHTEEERARFHRFLADPATAGKLDAALAADAKMAAEETP